MRKIFRKAMTILGSAALIGMTVGAASAASYPAPFTSNTAIVVGANAAPSDNIAASSIASNLDASAAAVTTGVVTGESVSLASGSDLLYLNDKLSENVQTLTKDNLPTVLADGVFADDDGTEYKFEQTLTLSASSDNGVAFTDSNNDLDDPTLALELSYSTSEKIYSLTATFNKAVNFTEDVSEGQDITLFGKTYTVSSATTNDTLILMGGAASAIINVGETKTVVVDGISYTIVLNGLSSAGTTQASITVNGETKTFTQGQSKTVGGVDAYVKTVFRTGDDGSGYVEVQLGSGKLTLESDNAVQVGTDTDDIEGTLVTITGGFEATTKIVIGVAAEDNDVNHLLPGESFVDPVFGTVLVNFDGVVGGPVFTGEQDDSRNLLEVNIDGNKELTLSVTDKAGNSATLPFNYNAVLRDDDGKVIHIVEGEAIADDEYFILNSGNNQHFMRMTKVNVIGDAAGDATDDVAMKDLLSGTTYTFDNHNFGSDGSGYDATILGQTYTITGTGNTDEVTIVSSEYTTKRIVYPYLELVSGEDTRVAMTDEVTIGDVTTVANTLDVVSTNTSKTYILPTGTLQFKITNPSTDTTAKQDATLKVKVDNGDFVDVTDTEVYDGTSMIESFKVGSVVYEVDLKIVDTATEATDVILTINSIAIDGSQVADLTDDAVVVPGLLFVEDEDKSESTTTTKNAVIVATTTDGVYEEIDSVTVTSANQDTVTWDDSDFSGTLTAYGTYILTDSSDSDQKLVSIAYGDSMMYAEVSISEGEAATSPEVGVVTVTDTNVASAAGKNLIVVGGSAINSVAAELLGAAYREAAFTSATGVAAGEFLIQSFSRAGKTALLVAGYNAADTEKATTYLLNNAITTTTGTKYKGTSATEASLVVA